LLLRCFRLNEAVHAVVLECRFAPQRVSCARYVAVLVVDVFRDAAFGVG
jgi:hypothetical protein